MSYTSEDLNDAVEEMLYAVEPENISLSSIINHYLPQYEKIIEWRNDLLVALVEQKLHEKDYGFIN